MFKKQIISTLFKLVVVVIITGGVLIDSYGDEAKCDGIVERIALRISGLKTQYEHFSGFDPKQAVCGHAIVYRHNVTYIRNPEYEKLVADQNALKLKNPDIKVHVISETAPVFSETDGIYLQIDFIDMSKEMPARVFEPRARIGNWVIDVSIEGAATKQIDEIRKAVFRIIDEEKIWFEQ